MFNAAINKEHLSAHVIIYSTKFDLMHLNF